MKSSTQCLWALFAGVALWWIVFFLTFKHSALNSMLWIGSVCFAVYQLAQRMERVKTFSFKRIDRSALLFLAACAMCPSVLLDWAYGLRPIAFVLLMWVGALIGLMALALCSSEERDSFTDQSQDNPIDS